MNPNYTKRFKTECYIKYVNSSFRYHNFTMNYVSKMLVDIFCLSETYVFASLLYGMEYIIHLFIDYSSVR